MKLITVGSDPQSNLYLKSQFVSGYHADIILKDNGEILLCDKGSTNGTLLNGSKISPNSDVVIRRGDNVVFADTKLDWSLIPVITPDATAKSIINIGSHSLNNVILPGPKVSRFHATIKQDAKGKWSICDHSTNGTTLNGVRIPKDTEVKLKAGDSIVCAGNPVQNPVPKGKGKTLAYIAAALLACLLVAGGALLLSKKPMHYSGQKLYEEYSPATVLIIMRYHYRITAGSLNVAEALGTSEFVEKDNRLVEYRDESDSKIILATGFYISDGGLIATNLHVVRPWLYDKNVQPVEDLVRKWFNDLSKTNPIYLNYISQVKAEGVVDEMYAIPHGQYVDLRSAFPCREVITSEDPEKDIAIIKAMLPGNKLQDGAKYIDINSTPDRSKYKAGAKIYTWGFPMATQLQDVNNKTLEAVFAEGFIRQGNNDYDFGHSATTGSGASGSPVFDEKGHLIGIIFGGFGYSYEYAIRSEYLCELMEKAKGKNNL